MTTVSPTTSIDLPPNATHAQSETEATKPDSWVHEPTDRSNSETYASVITSKPNKEESNTNQFPSNLDLESQKYAPSEKTVYQSPAHATQKDEQDFQRPKRDNTDETLDLETKQDLAMDIDGEFPEGGRGWLMVVGGFFIIAASFGLVNSWGVFQSHYQTVILPTTDPSTIAWIGSVQYSFIFLPGLLAGRLFDLGYLHAQIIPASIAIVVSTMLVAECTEYWQFMLCQGIVTGLGCGFCFGPCVPTLSHWFKKKRATALAIVASGSAIGGTVIPIAVRRLIPHVGFKWTMRILGLILLLELSIACALMKRRLPPVHVSGGLFNFRAFKYAPYTIYVGAACVAFLGLYTELTYVDVSGVLNGLSPSYSFYLVSIANAGSLVGRLGAGPLCDRFGNLNVLIPFNVVAAITTFAWPFCRSSRSLTAIAALYGCAVGAFAALVAIPVASLGDTGDVGRRTGMLFSFCAIASLVGPPISGAIYSKHGDFVEVGVYAGCMILGSSVLMFASRWSALGGKLRGKF